MKLALGVAILNVRSMTTRDTNEQAKIRVYLMPEPSGASAVISPAAHASAASP